MKVVLSHTINYINGTTLVSNVGSLPPKKCAHGPYHLGPQELHTVTSSISMIYLRLKYKEIAW